MLINIEKYLPIESGVNHRFCAEALATAVCLHNKHPFSAIKENIPEEIWSGSGAKQTISGSVMIMKKR